MAPLDTNCGFIGRTKTFEWKETDFIDEENVKGKQVFKISDNNFQPFGRFFSMRDLNKLYEESKYFKNRIRGFKELFSEYPNLKKNFNDLAQLYGMTISGECNQSVINKNMEEIIKITSSEEYIGAMAKSYIILRQKGLSPGEITG